MFQLDHSLTSITYNDAHHRWIFRVALGPTIDKIIGLMTDPTHRSSASDERISRPTRDNHDAQSQTDEKQFYT